MAITLRILATGLGQQYPRRLRAISTQKCGRKRSYQSLPFAGCGQPGSAQARPNELPRITGGFQLGYVCASIAKGGSSIWQLAAALLLLLPLAASAQAPTITAVSPAANAASAARTSPVQVRFDQALTAFRWTFRMGGQPHLSKPVTTPTGGKKSHFITLANRP